MRKKVCKAALQTPQSKKEEKRCSLSWSRSSPAAHGETTVEPGHPGRLQPVEGPKLDQGKNMRRKKQQRGAVMD